ncbi:hypothetical protein GF318_03940 [Candidatus Micrarchaeota archaeon]|nr:hypothetical protein [Candidatus Micrarchaeota archaeon]
MVEKRWLKWSTISVFLVLGLAVFGVILYLLIPAVLSSLTGFELGNCQDYSLSKGPPVQASLYELCSTSQAFLSVLTMVLIAVGGAMSLVPMALVSIDIFQAKGMGGIRKVAWLAVMWLLLGIIAATAYYFIEKKD